MDTPGTETVIIADAERLAWRCGGCLLRPILATYTVIGGCFLRISRHRHNDAMYITDLTVGYLDAHCPACHTWRRLEYRDGAITEGPRPEDAPRIECAGCSTERAEPGPAILRGELLLAERRAAELRERLAALEGAHL